MTDQVAKTQDRSFDEWCVLELFGHRRLAGRVSEQEIAGAAFLRIDVPDGDGATVATQFYSASAVYAITPTTEQIARAFAAGHQPAPVTRWELRLPEESGPPPFIAAHRPSDPDAIAEDEDEIPF